MDKISVEEIHATTLQNRRESLALQLSKGLADTWSLYEIQCPIDGPAVMIVYLADKKKYTITISES